MQSDRFFAIYVLCLFDPVFFNCYVNISAFSFFGGGGGLNLTHGLKWETDKDLRFNPLL